MSFSAGASLRVALVSDVLLPLRCLVYPLAQD